MSEAESLEKTKQLLLKWKNDKNIQKLKSFYKTKSFSGILGVERREMSHSSFIAWILDDKESHNLSQFAIRQLFDILIEWGEDKIHDSLDLYNERNSTKLEYDNLYKSLMLGTYKIEDLNIDVEKVIKDKKRIDIIISMTIDSEKENVDLPPKVNIIIENKVDSSEYDNQTKTYYNYYSTNEKYKNDLNLFVYLLPISTSRLHEKLADDEHYINMNYQLLSDNIFERALTHDISDRVRFIISEYLLSLRKPSKENKGQTMATGQLEKELLKEFWEEHQALLNPAFGVLKEIAIEDGDEEAAKTFGNMQKESKDLTKYSFNGKYNLSKGKLVLEVVRQYVIEHPDATFQELEQEFYSILRKHVVATLEDAIARNIKDNKKRYFVNKNDVITLADGTEISVYSGWSAGGNFENIFEFAKIHNYIIT